MTVTTPLKQDHRLLRTKLEFLEAALRVAPEAQFALREMCFSLARLLEEHVKREEQALAPYSNRIQAILRYRASQDHADQRAVLRDVNALLLQGIKAPTSTVVTHLSQLIDELREHMAEEEREVFPAVDRAQDGRGVASERRPPTIGWWMSANAVMKAFPETRRVFEQHGITCTGEGCDCLDELAWRRGLDVKDFIEELYRAAEQAESAEAALTA